LLQYLVKFEEVGLTSLWKNNWKITYRHHRPKRKNFTAVNTCKYTHGTWRVD